MSETRATPWPQPFDPRAQYAEARAQYIEDGSEVVRCHTFPTLRPQTVGQHSFAVAWWCAELMDGAPSVDLLMAALAHDLPEAKFGDIPAPAKRAMTGDARGDLENAELDSMYDVGLPWFEGRLTPQERNVLKLADYLELLAYTVREMALGSRHRTLLLCHENAIAYVLQVLNSSHGQMQLGDTAFRIANVHLTRLTKQGEHYVSK